MSSGAFALYIDQAAGGGPGAVVRRVIPLPPTFGGGAIKFNHGWISLAYDDFESDDAAFVRVRIVNVEGVRLDQQFQFFRGRTVVSEILAGDLLASFEVAPSPTPGGPRPVVTALVEYSSD